MDNPTFSGDERRSSPRNRPAKSIIHLICQRGELFLGPNVAESLVDASESGLGLVVRDALAAGERVGLSVEAIGHPVPIQRLGRVAWCSAAGDGLFRAGVELDTPLEYAELMSISSD
jgi:hypothetical protein